MLLLLASPALLSPRLIRRRSARIACSTNAQAPLTTPLAPRHLRAYAAGELYPTRIVDRNSVECYALSNADAEAERTRALRLVVGVLGRDRVERALANGGIGSLLRDGRAAYRPTGSMGPPSDAGRRSRSDEMYHLTSW